MTNPTEKPDQVTPDKNDPQPADPTLTRALISPAKPQPAMIKRVIEAVSGNKKPDTMPLALDETPWILQQFFNGEIDLDVELAQRFQNMPVMATISFRDMGTKSKRGVATLATQDGAAQIIVDVDAISKVVQFSFTFGSMLTLRFWLKELTDQERSRWLELMRREQGGLTFLWNASRWESDYLICVVRRYFTNLYAFSENNFEAAIRMTPDVTKQFLGWLEGYWNAPPPVKSEDTPPNLLNW